MYFQENCKADGAALLELGTIEELLHITGAIDGILVFNPYS